LPEFRKSGNCEPWPGGQNRLITNTIKACFRPSRCPIKKQPTSGNLENQGQECPSTKIGGSGIPPLFLKTRQNESPAKAPRQLPEKAKKEKLIVLKNTGKGNLRLPGRKNTGDWRAETGTKKPSRAF